jgi:ABC-type glycerol-3-phosphate transport system substrate-binding protein
MWKKITLTAAAAAILTGSLAGCGAGSDKIAVGADGKTAVSIMTAAYQPESASDDASKNPVMAQAEEELSDYVGTPIDLTIRFAASSNYGEKVTAAMGAGTYPNIMKVPDRTSAIVQNCRGGTFWDITDHISIRTLQRRMKRFFIICRLTDVFTACIHRVTSVVTV